MCSFMHKMLFCDFDLCLKGTKGENCQRYVKYTFDSIPINRTGDVSSLGVRLS